MNGSLTAAEFYKTLAPSEQKKISIFDKDHLLDDDVGIREKKKTVERPITPIDQAMKKPPNSDEQLTSRFRERLRINTDLDTVTYEDQTQLANILTRAIVAAWPEHRKQSDDPFLNHDGNKELERRVAVYVIKSCEDLFYQSITDLEDLNNKKVFSPEANISRMKTQLAAQANKSLNILDVRRKIAEEMRKLPDEAWFKAEEGSTSGQSIDGGPVYQAQAMSEKARHEYRKQQLQELNDQMPVLRDFDRNILFEPNSQKFDTVEEEPTHYEQTEEYHRCWVRISHAMDVKEEPNSTLNNYKCSIMKTVKYRLVRTNIAI